MGRTLKLLFASLSIVALITMGEVSTRAEAGSAKVAMDIYKAGFVIGASGGRGAMTFQGRNYGLGIAGVSVGVTFGASKATLNGTASNVNVPSDIAGIYFSAQAGAAVGRHGEKIFVLQNDKGVELKLSGSQVGLELALDLDGMHISLK